MNETITMSLYGMMFEWDSDKEELAFKIHGVHFSEAVHVFFDPQNITNQDYRDYDEIRYITLGMSNQFRLVKVVWTEREPNTRIISAWKANAQDKKVYENY